MGIAVVGLLRLLRGVIFRVNTNVWLMQVEHISGY